MKKGDKFFFYHTGDEKQVVGIGEVIRDAYPDPTAKKDEPWVAVTTGAVEPLPKPVTLAAIKAEPKLKDMALVKHGRLSVQPVTAERMEARLQDGRHESLKGQAATSVFDRRRHLRQNLLAPACWSGTRARSRQKRSRTPSSNALTTVSCT